MNDSQRVALIVNAGEHAGPAVARRLASGGASLVLHAPPPELVKDLDHSDALVVAADLTTASGHVELVARTLDRFRRLDAAWIRTGMRPYRGCGA